MTLNELKPSVAEFLRNKKPYTWPLVIQTGPDYRVMQRVLPFDPKEWQQDLAKVPPVPKPVTTKQVEPAPTPTATSAAISTASTTTSIAEKSTEANAQISSKLAAFYVLEAWKEAWETQDAKNYLSSYSPNLTPNRGLSLDAWKEKRTKSIFRPSSIKIEIEDPVVENLTENKLLITFKQSYTSNSYHDIVVKTLTMEKEENG